MRGTTNSDANELGDENAEAVDSGMSFDLDREKACTHLWLQRYSRNMELCIGVNVGDP